MNQKTVIAILGVVVIILISTTVYFATVNKASQPVAPASKVAQQPTSTPTPTVQQPTQLATPNNQSYIEVKELGFKIPVSSEMAQKITYAIGFKDKFNDFSNQAYFSTKELNADYKDCAGWPGVHQIEKISGKPTDDKNKTYEIGYDLPGGNKNKVVRDGIIKQFDGFYLFATRNHQSSCSDLKALDAEGSVIDTINKGLENAILITK